VFAAIFSGILLRLHHIGYNFDGDELFSVQAASNSFSQLVAVSLQDRTHPPLHLILLFFWMKAFGTSEVSARLLSVVASLFFLILVYRIAGRWMKEWPTVFVVAICSASPFFVYFGQQARPYSFIALFSSLTVFLFLKAKEEPSKRSWGITYGCACAALMYSQYVGALLLFPQFVLSAFSKSFKQRGMLLSGVIGMFSISPWILILGRNLLPGHGKLQENIGWIPRPSFFTLISYQVSLFGWLPAQRTGRILLVLCLVVLSSLVFRYRSVEKTTLLFVGTSALLQPFVLFVFSVFGPISIWATRQVIGSALFLICLFGIAVGLHHRFASGALAVVLVGWCVVALPDAFPEHSKPPWRSIADLVDRKCNTCDVVGAEKWVSFPLGYYAKRAIQDFPDYDSRVGQTERVLFLCRPVRCEALNSFLPRYKEAERNRISWSLQSPSSTEVIDIYLLEKVPAVRPP
jgi:4-amino-4-deoxy-L-arabinose transferase-like glycosyltransferase